jgi:hypothetical protein
MFFNRKGLFPRPWGDSIKAMCCGYQSTRMIVSAAPVVFKAVILVAGTPGLMGSVTRFALRKRVTQQLWVLLFHLKG